MNTATAPSPPLFSWYWIVRRNFDLPLFILSSIVTYAMLLAHFWLGIEVILLWWFWVIFFDGPHVFATWVRTYFDTEERQKRKSLLGFSLLIFLIPPFALLLDNLLGTRFYFVAFAGIFFCYQWWHVFRQHYGFVVLYQKKNGEPSGQANRWDYRCFHALMILPFVAFVLQGQAPVNAATFSMELSGTEHWVFVLRCFCVALLLGYLLRLLLQRPVNGPKLLLLVAVLPFPFLVLFHPVVGAAPFLLLAASATIAHNIQYQGIVWHYAQNRYRRNADSEKGSVERFGLAPKITSSVWKYYLGLFLVGVCYRYGFWTLEGSTLLPLVPSGLSIGHLPLGSVHVMKDVFFGFAMSLSLHHFVLDQFIWKVSKDKELQTDLRVEPSPVGG